MTARERLTTAFAPELVAAFEAFVAERVRAEFDTAARPDAWSPWLSIDEAASYLRVSKRTVERLLADETIPSSRVDRRRIVRRADLDAYTATAGEGEAPTTPSPRPPRGVG